MSGAGGPPALPIPSLPPAACLGCALSAAGAPFDAGTGALLAGAHRPRVPRLRCPLPSPAPVLRCRRRAHLPGGAPPAGSGPRSFALDTSTPCVSSCAAWAAANVGEQPGRARMYDGSATAYINQSIQVAMKSPASPLGYAVAAVLLVATGALLSSSKQPCICQEVRSTATASCPDRELPGRFTTPSRNTPLPRQAVHLDKHTDVVKAPSRWSGGAPRAPLHPARMQAQTTSGYRTASPAPGSCPRFSSLAASETTVVIGNNGGRL